MINLAAIGIIVFAFFFHSESNKNVAHLFLSFLRRRAFPFVTPIRGFVFVSRHVFYVANFKTTSNHASDGCCAVEISCARYAQFFIFFFLEISDVNRLNWYC